MKKHQLLLLILILSSGCAYHASKVYDPATGNLAGKTRTYTLFDSQSSLSKYHLNTLATTNAHGTFSPGISIGGLNQETSSTNINALIGAVIQGAIEGAIKANVKP